MRLISQDGMIDVPYQKVVVSLGFIYHTRIVCWWFGCTDGEVITLGNYSTVAKALKVMEMLRKEYLETVYDYRTKPKVFQFPKNEDVEVQYG